MNSTTQVDELVKEYLLFRGFTNTFRAFEQESRNDRDKGFQADRIIDELYSYVHSSDINGLLNYWQYLDLRYFSRLDGRFSGSVKKFELCLLRYYLVYAIQSKRKEKVFEFFETYGSELNGIPEWTKWFGLPFAKNPATDPNFETFFTRQWLDTFGVSLHNFLNTIFQNMPLPSLLCFNLDRIQRKALESEIETLQTVVENLKSEIESSDHEISSLKEKITQSRSGTSKNRRRATSMFEQKDLTSSGKKLVSQKGADSPRPYPDDGSGTPVSIAEDELLQADMEHFADHDNT